MGKLDFTSDSSANSRRVVGPLSLYAENPFRVLGMPVDAEDIELQEQHNKLKTYASLGRIKEVYTVAFGCEPLPSASQLDRALERLNNGEQRASDEFFWFWPREVGAKDDPGLDAIAEGDSEQARQIWREWEQKPGRGRSVARHNLAVNYLLQALDETEKHLSGSSTKNKKQLENAWKNADKRWDEIASSDDDWEDTKKRILSKNDPALTVALADQMKRDLRKTLAAIHGDIARRYADQGKIDWATFHVGAMSHGQAAKVDDDYRKAVREIAKPICDRLEGARTRVQSFADTQEQDKKKQAFEQAKKFFENDFEKTAKPALDLFYAGDDSLEKEKNRIYDKVADTICDCCVAAFNARQKADESTDDDSTLLKKALDIATDPQLKKRLIDNGAGQKRDTVLAEIMRTFKEIIEGTGNPSARFRKLQGVLPKLKAWASDNPEHEEHDEILKTAAILARQLSVDIFNKEDDAKLAMTAINLAIDLTPDAADRKQFQTDLEELENQLLKQQILITFKEVAESKEAAALRFTKLNTIREKVHRWVDSHPESDEGCQKFMEMFAALERNLSVGIFNEGSEAIQKGHMSKNQLETIFSMALRAICQAVEDTSDEGDRKKFLEDYSQLVLVAKPLGIDIPAKPKRRKRETWDPVTKPKPELGPKPKPKPRPDSRSHQKLSTRLAGQLMWAFVFATTMFFLSFVFRHYCPDGIAVMDSFVLTHWHLPVLGSIVGLLFPWSKLSLRLMAFIVFNFGGWFYTLAIWLVVWIHNATVSEASAWELWWGPIVGFGLSLPVTLHNIASKKITGLERFMHK